VRRRGWARRSSRPFSGAHDLRRCASRRVAALPAQGVPAASADREMVNHKKQEGQKECLLTFLIFR
jgi:hypothetical protein